MPKSLDDRLREIEEKKAAGKITEAEAVAANINALRNAPAPTPPPDPKR